MEQQTQEELVTDFKNYDVSDLAWLIIRDWKKTSKKGIYFGAQPYLGAMRMMDSFDQMYGCDTGKSIGIYFLSNATNYRGEQAKLVKAEIKRRLGIK